MKNINFPRSYWSSIWTLTHEKRKLPNVTKIFHWDLNPWKTQIFQRHIDLQLDINPWKTQTFQCHIDIPLGPYPMKITNFPRSSWSSTRTLNHGKHKLSNVTLIFKWEKNKWKTQTEQRHIDIQLEHKVMKNTNLPRSHWSSTGTITHEKQNLSKVTLSFILGTNPWKTPTFHRHIDLQLGH